MRRSRCQHQVFALIGSLLLTAAAVAEAQRDDGVSGETAAVGEEASSTSRGRLTWAEDHYYEGGLKAGRMHGRGVLATPDGEVYEGDFVEDQRHGQGTLRFPNGDVYTGDFRTNEMTGVGVLTWTNGDTYRGDFVHGIRSGRGVFEWQDGGMYVGGFEADQRHGIGHYRWRDGTLYKGHFAFGRQHGPGIKRSADDVLSFEVWDDGQRTSAVIVEAADQCTLVIDDKPWMFNGGQCINGLAHGEGLAVALDGTAYIPNGRFILGRLVRGLVRSVEHSNP